MLNEASPASQRDIVGVDGCRAGWLVVWLPAGRLSKAKVTIEATFAQVLTAAGGNAFVAVDMPIGLPERSGRGGRDCDVAARANLGARQSSLFAVPARAAVYAEDYASACQVALAHSDPPRQVSKQCFHLFPKIREVDGIMTADLQSRVVECHPELAFWRLNGGHPLALPKKVKSQNYLPGLQLRQTLLRNAGFSPDLLEKPPTVRAHAGLDDLLDACACAASALRIAAGDGRCFPSRPQRDAKGLRMEIWC
jgi:predicted RNase H-like nuclease